MNFPIRMYTTTWCGDCRRAKRFLKERAVAFEEINIEETPGAADFVVRSNHGKRCVPTFELGGRVFPCSPFDPEKLIRELGLEQNTEKVKSGASGDAFKSAEGELQESDNW